MSNELFGKNLPPQGILCKDDTGVVVNALRLSESSKEYICVGYSNSLYHFSDLTLLTAEEWWKFAPWQDIAIAPKDGTDIFILCKDGRCFTGNYHFGEFRNDDNSVLSAVKWLPLPNQTLL